MTLMTRIPLIVVAAFALGVQAGTTLANQTGRQDVISLAAFALGLVASVLAAATPGTGRK